MKCWYAFFLSTSMLPKGFKYPEPYIQFVDSPLPNLGPWIFFDERPQLNMGGLNYLEIHFKSLQKRYPARTVVPFARRFDNNDVACFDASSLSDNPRVVVIDCFASPGSESHGEYDNFMEWLEVAKKTTQEWKALWRGEWKKELFDSLSDEMQLGVMLSCALYYAPWLYELEPDDKGWIPVDQLFEAFKHQDSKWAKLTESSLQQWIDQFDGEDYELSENKIRMYVDTGKYKTLSRKKAEPPALLYHVADTKFLDLIMSEGLKPMDRQYVHLLVNEKIVRQVGMCKTSDPIILYIEANWAYFDGVMFYKGNEEEWLADYIPPQYIQKIPDSE